jgi:hypothetical protein
MLTLTRRRYPDRKDCRRIYYADVCVGTISRRAGCPVDEDQWEWGSGMDPAQGQNSTAADFDQGRADFEAAWRRILPACTKADF